MGSVLHQVFGPSSTVLARSMVRLRSSLVTSKTPSVAGSSQSSLIPLMPFAYLEPICRLCFAKLKSVVKSGMRNTCVTTKQGANAGSSLRSFSYLQISRALASNHFPSVCQFQGPAISFQWTHGQVGWSRYTSANYAPGGVAFNPRSIAYREDAPCIDDSQCWIDGIVCVYADDVIRVIAVAHL